MLLGTPPAGRVRHAPWAWSRYQRAPGGRPHCPSAAAGSLLANSMFWGDALLVCPSFWQWRLGIQGVLRTAGQHRRKVIIWTGTCALPAPQDHAGGSQSNTGTKSQKWETSNTSNRGLDHGRSSQQNHMPFSDTESISWHGEKLQNIRWRSYQQHLKSAPPHTPECTCACVRGSEVHRARIIAGC